LVYKIYYVKLNFHGQRLTRELSSNSRNLCREKF